MTINDVLLKENINKKFKDNNDDVWQVEESEVGTNEHLFLVLANESRMPITNLVALDDILKLEFQELIDFNIICPHCRHEHDGLECIDTGDMEGDFFMNCEKCGKEFKVSFTTYIKFETEK